MKTRNILSLLFFSALYTRNMVLANPYSIDNTNSVTNPIETYATDNIVFDRITTICDDEIPKGCPPPKERLMTKTKFKYQIENIMQNDYQSELWSELLANGVRIEILTGKTLGTGLNAAALFVNARNVIIIDEFLTKTLKTNEIERIIKHEGWHANIYWRNRRHAELEHRPKHSIDATPYYNKENKKTFQDAINTGDQRILQDFKTLHYSWFLGLGNDRQRYLSYTETCKNYQPRLVNNYLADSFKKSDILEMKKSIADNNEKPHLQTELKNGQFVDFYVHDIFKDRQGKWIASGYTVIDLNDSINAFLRDSLSRKYSHTEYTNEAELIRETDAKILGELAKPIVEVFYPELIAAHQAEERQALDLLKQNSIRLNR